MRYVLLFQFHTWGTKRFRNLPKVIRYKSWNQDIVNPEIFDSTPLTLHCRRWDVAFMLLFFPFSGKCELLQEIGTLLLLQSDSYCFPSLTWTLWSTSLAPLRTVQVSLRLILECSVWFISTNVDWEPPMSQTLCQVFGKQKQWIKLPAPGNIYLEGDLPNFNNGYLLYFPLFTYLHKMSVNMF